MLLPAYVLLAACHLTLAIGGPKTDEVFAQNCDEAPEETLQHICEQIRNWRVEAKENILPNSKPLKPENSDNSTEEKKVMPGGPISMPGQAFAGPGFAARCHDFQCLCSNSGGRPNGAFCTRNGQTFQMFPAVRKEYRMLTNVERQRFQDALNTIKSDGTYNVWAGDHVSFRSPAAHGGPAFLPWHREFLKRLEFELRAVDFSVGVPYWDSTLDRPLPEPRDSILWTPMFMGETDQTGHVTTGPFRTWRPTDNDWQGLRRNLASTGRHMDPRDLQRFQTARDFTALSDCFDWGNIEFTHGLLHQWVGGHMGPLNLSPNDPAFFMHHSFVDKIWEDWRSSRQSRWQRVNDYPRLSRCSDLQGPNQHMSPFPMNNIDGLSNHYTDQLYRFDQSPTCTSNNRNCGSEFLFCDTVHGAARCVSKVKMRGRCDGFEGQDICYEGVCNRGRCEEGGNQVSQTPPTTTQESQPEFCYNRHQCCDWWAERGSCSRNVGYMSSTCPAACNRCSVNRPSDCHDYFDDCRQWANQNECVRSMNWMAENCRSSCGWCNRMKQCGNGFRDEDGDTDITTTTTRTTARPTTRATRATTRDSSGSSTCFNQHRCCVLWAEQNQCSENRGYMNDECALACGQCRATFEETSDCVDFHGSCVYWASVGECAKNRDWMNHNCRESCNSCHLHTRDSLAGRCTLVRRG